MNEFVAHTNSGTLKKPHCKCDFAIESSKT